MAAPIWIKHPLAVFADNAEDGVVVQDGRIVELVPRGTQPAEPGWVEFDASAHVVLPGLINAHHHFYQTLTRANSLAPDWDHLTKQGAEAAATVALAELLLSGCTATVDHLDIFPRNVTDAMDIEIAVARRLGIRLSAGRGMVSSFSNQDEAIQDEDTVLATCQRQIVRYHDPAPSAMTRISIAPSSLFSMTQSLMKKVVQLTARPGVRLHTHLGETAEEAALCEDRFGCRPVDYLEECGWLGDRTWIAHGIELKKEEATRLSQAGTALAHCPSSNQMLGRGHCRVADLERLGMRIGLGVDGVASNMMQEIHAAFLLQRHHYGADKISPKDALRWATEGSAACIGRPELGRIAVDGQADLALFKLDELRFSGAADPLTALVMGGAARADRVMVAGRWVVQDGAIPNLDVAALIKRHSAAAVALFPEPIPAPEDAAHAA